MSKNIQKFIYNILCHIIDHYANFVYKDNIGRLRP